MFDEVGVESVHVTGTNAGQPSTERLLLTYADRVLETRDTDSHLLSSTVLTLCPSYEMYRLPVQSALVAFTSEAGGGLSDAQTGEVVEQVVEQVVERTPISGYRRNVLLTGSLVIVR